MRLIMILWQLLKHSKNIKWYCAFKTGRCYVVLLPEKWMEYFYYYYSLEQYEAQESFVKAIKYQKIYNRRLYRDEKKKQF